MKRYIAFLRGVNISGKNKISMSELKEAFENRNFDYIAKIYGGIGIRNKIKRVLRKVKRKMIG